MRYPARAPARALARAAAPALALAFSLAALPPGQAEARARYPAGARHSPITAELAARAGEVVSRGGGRREVFAKVGDSITAASSFLTCFAQPSRVDLAGRDELAETWAFFSKTPADGLSPSWSRKSLSARPGWSTLGAIGTHASSPLLSEIRAIKPAFALVMYGTNETYGGGLHNYERNLRQLVRMTLEAGVLPLVSTIPPRTDSVSLGALVGPMNEAVRAVAQAEQVPMIDYAGALSSLADRGLSPDGIHPRPREERPCDFSPRGLEAGMNVRNLLALEALDRVRRALAGELVEPDTAQLAGEGTLSSPLLVDALPFVDDGSLAGRPSPSAAEARGPEVVYEVKTASPSRLQIELFSDEALTLRAVGGPQGRAWPGPGGRSLALEVPEGTTLIAVGGKAGGEGAYRLSITASPRRR